MRRFAPLLSIVIVVLSLAISWHPRVGAQDASPAARDTEAVAKSVVDVLNEAIAGDTSGIDALFADNYVNHTAEVTPAGAEESDREELKATFKGMRSAFSDAVFTVDDVLVEGDLAAVRFHGTGTLDPAALGMPGEAQRVEMGGVAIVRIANGQVVESWDYDEFAEYLLGLAAPEQTSTSMAGTPAA